MVRGARGRGGGHSRPRVRGASSSRGSQAPTTAGSSGEGDTTNSGQTQTPPVSEATGAASPSVPVPRSSAAKNSPGVSTQPRDALTPIRGGPPPGRFRPKNIRRDEAERDSLARQELAKQNERAVAEARQRGRGSFRGRRSRGDLATFRGRIIGNASGAFSQAPPSEGSGRPSSGFATGGGSTGGRSGGPSSLSGGVRESKSGFATKTKREEGYATGEGQPPPSVRINADKLTFFPGTENSDSEDDFIRSIRERRPDAVLPVTIARKEHREQQVTVATTEELEMQDSLWVGGSSSTTPNTAQPEDNAVWPDAANIPVKKEPGTEDEPVDFDKSMKRPHAESKPTPQVLVDPEEALLLEDLKKMAVELDPCSHGGSESDEPSGRLMLFQFPPIMPPLHVVPQLDKRAGTKADADGDTEMFGQPTIDLTQDPKPKGKLQTGTETLPAEGGIVGTLKIRKSGRAELDWGGMTFEVNRAAERQFLATAVIVEQDEKPKPGAPAGRVYPMGKIWGRYIVSPKFSEEKPWVVDPEYLRQVEAAALERVEAKEKKNKRH